MAKNNFLIETFITDKNKSLDTYKKGLLLRTNQIFTWENLPKGLKTSQIEFETQKNGKVYIIKNNDVFYVVTGNETGDFDAYGNFKSVSVNNPYMTSLNGTYLKSQYVDDITDKKICVELKNNYLGLPIIELLSHYAVMITECEITLRSYIINSRNIFTLVAGDNKAVRNCESFLEKLKNGDLTILSDNSFLETIKILPTSVSGDLIYKLLEVLQYLKASALHEVGINANYDLKRTITTKTESDLNLDYLIPLVDNMYRCRLECVSELNKIYNLNVDCDLHSTWLNEKLKTESELHNEDNEKILQTDQTEQTINEHIKESV